MLDSKVKGTDTPSFAKKTSVKEVISELRKSEIKQQQTVAGIENNL